MGHPLTRGHAHHVVEALLLRGPPGQLRQQLATGPVVPRIVQQPQCLIDVPCQRRHHRSRRPRTGPRRDAPPVPPQVALTPAPEMIERPQGWPRGVEGAPVHRLEDQRVHDRVALGPHRQHGPLSALPGRPHLLHLSQHPHGQREHRPFGCVRRPVQLHQPPQKRRHILLPQLPRHQQQHLVPGRLLRPFREQRDQFFPLPLLFLPPPQQVQRRQVLHEGPVHEAVQTATVVGQQKVPGAQVIDQLLRRRHRHRGAHVGLHQEVADNLDQVVMVNEGPTRLPHPLLHPPSDPLQQLEAAAHRQPLQRVRHIRRTRSRRRQQLGVPVPALDQHLDGVGVHLPALTRDRPALPDRREDREQQRVPGQLADRSHVPYGAQHPVDAAFGELPVIGIGGPVPAPYELLHLLARQVLQHQLAEVGAHELVRLVPVLA